MEYSSAYTLIADAGKDQIVNEGDTVYFEGKGNYDPYWHRLVVNFATDSALYLRTQDPIGPWGGGWEGGVMEWITFNSSNPFWIGKRVNNHPINWSLGQIYTGKELTYYWKIHESGQFNLSFRAANGNFYADVYDDTNGTCIIQGLHLLNSPTFTKVERELIKGHVYRLYVYDTTCESAFPNDLDILFYIDETDVILTPDIDSLVYYVSVDPLILDFEGSGVTNITFFSRGLQEFYTYYLSEFYHTQTMVSEGELLDAPDPYKEGITPGEYNDTLLEPVLLFSWDFDANEDSDGDGNFTNDKDAIEPTPTHVYLVEGMYTVTLNISDPFGFWSLDICNITVYGCAPPLLFINTSSDGKDVVLNWIPSYEYGIEYYLIYRATSQTEFDFSVSWKNTSIDREIGELAPQPIRTMWNDTNAADPSNLTSYEEQYYYVVRAVNGLGKRSSTSRTVGKWTKIFPEGISTFSLPLEPMSPLMMNDCLLDMGADCIRWMDPTTRTWNKHGDGGVNDTQLEGGKGYEVNFDKQVNYTFTGMPGAMIKYDDDSGFLGFDPDSGAKHLTATVDPFTGNVTLSWTQPLGMDGDDTYKVYRSTTRDGFDKGTAMLLDTLIYGDEIYIDPGVASSPGQYYYMIVPFNETGIIGASTYSIGIWIEDYLSGYDTLGIPLKQSFIETADWYCDNIPDTVGMNYYIVNEQRWGWHSERMPALAYDPVIVMTEGYQISTSIATKFIFIGV